MAWHLGVRDRDGDGGGYMRRATTHIKSLADDSTKKKPRFGQNVADINPPSRHFILPNRHGMPVGNRCRVGAPLRVNCSVEDMGGWLHEVLGSTPYLCMQITYHTLTRSKACLFFARSAARLCGCFATGLVWAGCCLKLSVDGFCS